MFYRPVLLVLVFGMILLGVAFAVLMAFYALVSTLGDAAGAKALFWVATTCLVLLVIDMVLLLAALGLRATRSSGRPPDDE